MTFQELWSIETQPIDTGSSAFIALLIGLFLIMMMGAALHEEGVDDGKNPLATFLKRSKFILWIIVIIVASLAGAWSFHKSEVDRDQLISKIRTTEVATIQGVVHVHFIQPRIGHTIGDLVEVEGIKFQVSQHTSTQYYHVSLNHGGVLIEGQQVRISFIRSTESESEIFGDGKIVKIESWQQR
jgi:hypothetical protein